jgi:hypothetical protein
MRTGIAAMTAEHHNGIRSPLNESVLNMSGIVAIGADLCFL